MEKVEAVIVGAGLAGLSCAYTLAGAGVETLVVERGDYPGSKNVTGGRLYTYPVRRYLPHIWEEAPLERYVTKERLTALSENSSVTVELTGERLKERPHHSYTILRAKFDGWLAERAAEKGALIVTKNRVDDLLWQDGKVVGIRSAEAEIQAQVVVAADGAFSSMAQKAGLAKERKPRHYAVGVKEVIELPKATIEERFNLEEGQGVAHLFFGSLTQGLFGGGFLYTNLESISVGLVVGIQALMERGAGLELYELLDAFQARPEVAPLIAGGEPVEYAAHLVPEGGLHALPRLQGDGILLVGDAAGLALNTGLTVRGMDFALASGILAAQAIIRAREEGDFSAASLARYEESLKGSFVLQDLHTYKEMPEFLANPRLFTLYPQAICDILMRLLWVGQEPQERISATLWREVKKSLLHRHVLGDLFKVWRV